jgi:FKBP-type peptidyl-prolyl cis-trans isomerase 2
LLPENVWKRGFFSKADCRVIFLKEGSIIEIDYTGRAVLTGEVFESTVEKRAIETGIFNAKQKYEPMVVVVGEGDVLPGLDKALKEMAVGAEKKVLVKPADGWGERKPGNIAVVPLQQFKKEKMQPFPGLVVEINGRQGKVQSVSGGRVRIDFNHPLAGRDLEYELKVVKEISVPNEQVEALYKKYFYMVPDAEKGIVVGKDGVEVTLSPRWSANLEPLKQLFSRIVTKHVKGFGKVRFVEEFTGEKKQESVKAEAEKAVESKQAAGKKAGAKAVEEGKKAGAHAVEKTRK